MKKIVFFIIYIVIFSACDNTTTEPSNKFVIEAFLYANEPVSDIYIKSTFPISEVNDISEPISDAQVTLRKNNTTYPLVPSDSVGYYHYPDTDLTVETGDVFQLEVTYEGVTATAETIVPTPTEGLQVMPDTMLFPLLGFGPTPDSVRAYLGSLRMTATWDNPLEDYYYLTIESIADTPQSIFPDMIASILARFKYVSEPTNGISITVPGVSFTSLGTHRVKVYHINQEYVDLYLNQEQDSRDLNEPPSNVKNALGIFSAFNSQEFLMEIGRL